MDWSYTWHKMVYSIIKLPMSVAARLKFGFRREGVPKLSNPYIVVSNHTTFWDQYFLGVAFSRHMYFLASEHSFRMGLLSKLMKALMAPIGRIKGSTDAAAVMGILRRLKKGRNICMFPEGERSFDGRTAALHPTTAKLLKAAGVPVVTYRLKGGYLTDPRWAKHRRKGRVSGSVVRVYALEELKKMSAQQITDAVWHDIYEDAWETQRSEHQLYHGQDLAEGLEEALFICPLCGGIDTASGKGNAFTCACGMHAELDETGMFVGKKPFETIADWDDWQKTALQKRLEGGGEVFTDSGARLSLLGDDHRLEPVASGNITLTEDGLTVGERSFALSEMSEPATCRGKNSESLMFTSGGQHYEIELEGRSSRRKYAMAMKALRAVTNA